MVTTNLNLSMNNPEVVQIHAKQGDSGRIYKINLKDATEENGTLRILRPDGVEVTADAIKSAGGDAYKGDLVTFDALEEVPLTKAEVTLESSQDLHGLPNPYPGGGYKNLFDVNKIETLQSGAYGLAVTRNGDVFTLSGTVTAEGGGAFNIVVYEDTSLSGKGYKVQAFDVSGGTINNFYGFRTESEKTIAMAITRHVGDVVNMTFKISVAETTQTSWSPYSNICPIEPSNGVNLLPLSNGTYSLGATGASAVVENGKVTISGTTTSSGGRTTRLSNYFTLKAGTYTISPQLSASPYIRVYVNKKSDDSSVGYNMTFTLAEDTEVYVGIGLESGYTYDNVIYPQIVVGSAVSPYVPYQGIDVFQNGKNQFDITKSYYYVEGSNSITVSQGGYNANIFYNVNGNTALPSAYRKLLYLPQGTYTISFKNSTDEQKLQVYELDTDTGLRKDAFSVVSSGTTTDGRLYTTFTVPNDCYATIVRYINSSRTFSDIQLERNATATSYEPYNGTTYPLSLGQNVYGGTLDVVSGKLTVNRGYVDLGSLTWTYADNYKSFSATLAGVKNVEQTETPNLLSSMYQAGAWYLVATDPTKNGYVYVLPSYNQLRARNLNYDDGTIFQNAMNGVQLVYELATPIEYDLTPTQISTLLGENNVWSSGEVEVAFEYDGLFAQLPQQATAVVGRCIGDVNFTNVSTMPFTLNVIPNNQEETP